MSTLSYKLTETRKLPQVCVQSCSFGGSVTWLTGHRLQDVGDELHELGQRLDLWSPAFLINENSGYEDVFFAALYLGLNLLFSH